MPPKPSDRDEREVEHEVQPRVEQPHARHDPGCFGGRRARARGRGAPNGATPNIAHGTIDAIRSAPASSMTPCKKSSRQSGTRETVMTVAAATSNATTTASARRNVAKYAGGRATSRDRVVSRTGRTVACQDHVGSEATSVA